MALSECGRCVPPSTYALLAVRKFLQSHPSYRAWGRGLSTALHHGREAIVVSVQRPEHVELARRWVGDRSNGFPIVFRVVGDIKSLGVGDAAVWPSDLLAYRQQWEPFIAAHLDLWRYLNSIFEATAAAKQCPAGIFTAAAISTLDAATQQFCASLALTRIRTSATDPGGILPQWNAWAGKSSAEILAGAPSILKWYQDVVLEVGGEYKDDLVKIAKLWNISGIELPPVPEFSAQESLIAHLEGAGLAAQGVLQIIGYGTGQVLVGAADTASAVAKGLRDTAKALPSVIGNPWTWIGITAVVAVVGGALIVHYFPASEPRHTDRLPAERPPRPAPTDRRRRGRGSRTQGTASRA